MRAASAIRPCLCRARPRSKSGAGGAVIDITVSGRVCAISKLKAAAILGSQSRPFWLRSSRSRRRSNVSGSAIWRRNPRLRRANPDLRLRAAWRARRSARNTTPPRGCRLSPRSCCRPRCSRLYAAASQAPAWRYAQQLRTIFRGVLAGEHIAELGAAQIYHAAAIGIDRVGGAVDDHYRNGLVDLAAIAILLHRQACRLALEHPEDFAGVAAISASLPVKENRDCGQVRQARSGNDHQRHRRPDQSLSRRHGKFGRRPLGNVLSSEDTAKYFANLLGVTAMPELAKLPHKGGSTTAEQHDLVKDGPPSWCFILCGTAATPCRCRRRSGFDRRNLGFFRQIPSR